MDELTDQLTRKNLIFEFDCIHTEIERTWPGDTQRMFDCAKRTECSKANANCRRRGLRGSD